MLLGPKAPITMSEILHRQGWRDQGAIHGWGERANRWRNRELDRDGERYHRSSNPSIPLPKMDVVAMQPSVSEVGNTTIEDML
ncbi:hypothetical protein HAX54_009136 [Datura stramonium]|uniref:Uncharacterized protein n=1 Tax=Datura stramonium TaxID=4076 RepID=A0ABS8TH68_DATST|nr:hypothetical protein [Datura stramonium]